MVRYNFSRFNEHMCYCYYNKLCMVHFGCQIRVFFSDLTVFYFSSIFRIHRGGSRIFSQGGSGGTKCQRDAAGVWGDGKKGGLGVLPQENLECEVL